jgi:hypothetical protein
MDKNVVYGAAGGVAAAAIGICVYIGLSRSKGTSMQGQGTSTGGSRRTLRMRRANNGTRRS